MITLVQLRYQFRLYPTRGQRAALARAFGCARVVFNDAIRAREDARTQKLPFPAAGELSKRLITEAKKTPERAWLREVSSVVLQQSLRDLDRAYRNFFEGMTGRRPRTGAPRYKSKRSGRQAIRFTRNAGWKITSGGKLRLPKVGDVSVRWSRALPLDSSSVTVIKDRAGRYFASFAGVVDVPVPRPTGGRQVGIDLGLTHFAILSDGTKVDNPRYIRLAERRLQKAHRSLSRKSKGSSNRAKARIKMARAHARVADRRRDFHHQLSTKLIRENQAVAVENLAVNGLARTRLAKSVYDAGWSQFVNMLEYKAIRYERSFVKISRSEPTSQVCSQCCARGGPRKLNERTWTCEACKAVLDRDINAAVNVAKAAGLAVSARGAQVRPGSVPAQRKEAGTHPKPRSITAQQAGIAPL